MDLLTSLKISSSGLAANRKRMAVISSNIANAQTTRTKGGGSYKRQEVLFKEKDQFSQILNGEMERQVKGVVADIIVSRDRSPIFKYEPEHPDANSQGYVAYPNINIMEEMANMISTSRSYEANISAMNTAKGMAMKSLEISR